MNAQAYEEITAFVRDLTINDWNGDSIERYWPDVDKPENRPDHRKPFIDVRLSKVQPDKFTVESGNCGIDRKWILRLNLSVPSGIGQAKPEGVIDRLEAAFPYNLTIGAFEVINVNPINSVSDNAARTIYPLLITLQHIS